MQCLKKISLKIKLIIAAIISAFGLFLFFFIRGKMRLKESLELEHIDGNAYNNSESNLSLLCPNCHSQTPTYKAKNKGNGRVERRERAKKDYHRTLDK